MENINFNPYSFEEFWKLYAKSVEKEKCRIKYEKLTLEEKKKIFETLPTYVENTPEKQYRKNPQTYLNNKSWNDEIIARKPTTQSIGATDTISREQELAERYRNKLAQSRS